MVENADYLTQDGRIRLGDVVLAGAMVFFIRLNINPTYTMEQR